MSQIIYPITHLPPVIDIGKQTEKGVTRIGFDVHEWLDDWPGMAFSVQPTRPGETESYFAASEMVGSVVFWLVGAVDTEKPGSGTVEVLGVTEDERKLSFMCRTSIANTNTATVSEVPEPNQPWVDQVIMAGETAKADAKNAAHSAQEAVQAASDAGQYSANADKQAASAAKSAASAGEAMLATAQSAEAVEKAKQTAISHADDAEKSAQAADLSASDAAASADAAAKSAAAIPGTSAPFQQLVTDAAGKVAWEDRLAYTTTAEVEVVCLEETVLTCEETFAWFPMPSPWAAYPVAGAVATVTYNGTDYECKVIDGHAFDPEIPPGILYMGNLGEEGFEGDNPDAPFAMAVTPNADLLDGMYAVLVPVDGATTPVTLSVTSKQTQTKVKTIAPEYLPPEAQHKRITLTIDKEGNLTCDTDFETAWAMDAAVLQSCVVIAKDGGLLADASSTERNSVSKVYKCDVNGVRSIQIQYENGVFDFSEPTSHTFTRYINWGCYGTETSLAMDGYTRHEMPFKGYPSTKAYLYWTGSEWRFATIDQLKADLGLS